MTVSNINYQISNIPPLLVLVGETASGKSSVAIKIAQKIDGEIICADSRTVYKKLDIGTAKPSKKEQQLVPHHLLDMVEPNENFTVAQFQKFANKCIQEIAKRGKIPIMVGGSGLYIDSVLYNFQFTTQADDSYRNELEQMSDEKLTTLLNTKDINKETLNTKNRRHVIRSIERGKEPPIDNVLRDNTLVLGLTLEREVLRKRVEARVEQMFKDGLIEETKQAVELFGWDNVAFSGAGYQAVKEYLSRAISEAELKQALVRRDMSLAKRQRTWFKRNQNIKWFNASDDLSNVAINTTFTHC